MTCASCAAHDREAAERAGRRDGRGELRHRARHGHLRPGARSAPTTSCAPSRPPATARSPLPAPGREPGCTSRRARSTRSSWPGSATGVAAHTAHRLGVLAVPVVLLSMIPALQFRNWQWLALDARRAGGDVGGVALPPRRAGSTSATAPPPWTRSISLGVTAAFGWSVVALFFGDAGEPGMKMTFTLTPRARRRAPTTCYLEVASAVTVFLLAGRYFEAGPSAGPAPRCGRCSSSAPRTSPWCRAGVGAARADRPAGASATCSSCARARRWPPTASSSRAARPSTPRC